MDTQRVHEPEVRVCTKECAYMCDGPVNKGRRQKEWNARNLVYVTNKTTFSCSFALLIRMKNSFVFYTDFEKERGLRKKTVFHIFL